jgi:nucleoid DNA-binding protein
MTKQDIVRRIADALECPQIDAKPIVQKTLDAIIELLAREGRLEFRNFGVFEIRKRKARQSRNPRTGEKVMVGERLTVIFKPGRVMEERVARQRGGQVAARETAPDRKARL